MAAEKGSAFLLKVGNGGSAADLRDDRRDADDAIVGERRGGERHQQGFGRLARAAVRRGRAIGLGRGERRSSPARSAEARIKGNALGGALDDYELSFESGERLRGRFLVTRLDYAGDHGGERTYAVALESSGAVAAV